VFAFKKSLVMHKKVVIGCMGLIILCNSTSATEEKKDYTGDLLLADCLLALHLEKSDTVECDEADAMERGVFQKIQAGDYYAAVEAILAGLDRFPTNFGLQARLASLIGDYAGNFDEPLKEQLIQKSKAVFDTLLGEVDNQSKRESYFFKNEYYYRFGLYKNQYELGMQKLADYWGTPEWNNRIAGSCYYVQGVGAANYARQLLIAGDEQLAFEYAQKAVVAWSKYFTYENDYYNAYVHYALALGILGHKEEMMRILLRSASMINKDLHYCEFKEVINFIEGRNH
jgi:hypothetical protein